MSRKDFELIADIIKDLRPSALIRGANPTASAQDDQYADSVALAFANRLVDTNARFDRARFLRACGVAS